MEVTVDNTSERIPINLPRVIFKKTIDVERKVHHFISNAPTSADSYYKYLEYAGLAWVRNLCMLSHRRLEDLVLMSGSDIYESIKELTGAKKYEAKRDQSQLILAKTDNEERKATELLNEVKDKLELLKYNMREYEKFERNTEEINTIKCLINERKLADLEEKLVNVAAAESIERTALEALQPEIEALNAKMQQQIEEVQLAERFIEEYQKMRERTEEGEWSETLTIENSVKGLEERAKVERAINDELREIEKKVVELEIKRSDVRNQLAHLDSEAQMRKANEEAMELSTAKDKQGKAAAEARRKELMATQGALEEAIMNLQDDLKDIHRESRDLERHQMETTETKAKSEEKLIEVIKKIEEIKKQAEPSVPEHRKLEFKLNNDQEAFIRTFDSLLLDITKANQQKTGIDIMHLLGLIRQFNVRFPHKFISLLFDLIGARESLTIPLEALFLHKLFAIVVEDEESVEDLIRLNREIGGGRISIRALSALDTEIDISKDNIKATDVPTRPAKKDIKSSYEEELRKHRVVLLKDWLGVKPDFDPYENRFSFLEYIMAHKQLAPKINNYLDGILGYKGTTIGGDSFRAFLDFSLKNTKTKAYNLDMSLLDKTELHDVSDASINYGNRFQEKIANLIQKTVNKGAVVFSLEDGHRFSSDLKVHCATKDGEVVYSGGYLAKVGYAMPTSNFLFFYQKIIGGFHNLRKMADDLGKLIRQKSSFDKNKSEYETQKDHLESEREALEAKVSIANSDLTFINEQLHKKKLQAAERHAELERKQQHLGLNKRIVENLANGGKTKEDGSKNSRNNKNGKQKEAEFQEKLKSLTAKLAETEQQLVEVRAQHSKRLRTKETEIKEALQKLVLKMKKKLGKENKDPTQDNIEIKKKKEVIELGQKRFAELRKTLKTKADEAETRTQHHATLLSQKESYQKRIMDIRANTVV